MAANVISSVYSRRAEVFLVAAWAALVTSFWLVS